MAREHRTARRGTEPTAAETVIFGRGSGAESRQVRPEAGDGDPGRAVARRGLSTEAGMAWQMRITQATGKKKERCEE